MQYVVQALVFAILLITIVLEYRIIYNRNAKNLLIIGAFTIVCLYGQLEGLTATSLQTTAWAMRTIMTGYLLFATEGTLLMCKFAGADESKIKRPLYVITAAFMILVLADEVSGPFVISPREPLEGLICNTMQYDVLPLGMALIAYMMILAIMQLRYGFVVCRQDERPAGFTVSSILFVLPFIAYLMLKMNLTGGMDFGPILQVICLAYLYYTVIKLHLWEDEVDTMKCVLASADSGYVVIDYSHSIVMHNSTAAKMFPELDINDEKGMIVELMLLHDGDVLNHEGRFYDIVVRDIVEDETITGQAIWAYDCTDRQNSIAELNEVKLDAIESKKMSELLAYHMTNGFGAPISVIKDRSDAIYKDERTTVDAKEMTLEVLDAVQRLEDMVNIMLDYGGALKSDFMHETHEYRTVEFAEKIKKLLESRRVGRCKEVSLELDANMPSSFNGCDDSIINVVESLVRSFCMATTPAGLKATLSAIVKQPVSNIKLSIVAIDNGKITSEFKRISMMRERGTESLNTEINNIPFSQSRRLLMEIQGSISFTVENGNSVIEISIPQEVLDRRSIAESENAAKDIASAEQNDKVILIVDDNMLYLRQMSSWLKKLGIKSLTAKSGQECLDIYEKEKVDMIFMDQMMPEMDGTQTFRKLRDYEFDNNKPKTPVIILTADDTDGARVRYLEIGFDGYISKPIQPHQITEKVRFFLG